MSDNMCGPSNAGKSLVTHAERDRSLHQDRVTGQPAGGAGDVGSSFRNQAQVSNAGNSGYHAFYQAQFAERVAPAAPDVSLFFPNGLGVPLMGTAPPTPPAAGHVFAPGGGRGQAQQASTARVSHATSNWAQEFNGNSAPINAAINAPVPVHAPFSAASVPAQNHSFALGGIPSASPFDPFMGTVRNDFGQHGFQHQQVNSAIYSNGVSANQATQFDAAFGDFVDARFEDDVAAATGMAAATDAVAGVTHGHDDAVEANAERSVSELQDEMDNWMATHHPRNDDPDYYLTEITSTMERIAMQQDNLENAEESTDVQDDIQTTNGYRRDPALEHAAAQVLQCVSDNTSEKFQQSNFFALMKRIAEHELVVEGENFVETSTGATYRVNLERTEDGDAATNDTLTN